ncbi:hypothetical protein OROHE_017047 [Orobanche hederae]
MIILFVLIIVVYLESPTVATGKLGFVVEDQFSGREDLVKWAGYGEEKLSTVVIHGKLLCHGGGARETISNHDSHPPVSGATVAVFCGSSARSKKLWAESSTDSSGNFIIDLPSHLHAIPNLEKLCHVKVVHLPKLIISRCCPPRHSTIELTSVGEGIRSYTTNNIFMMPHNKHT